MCVLRSVTLGRAPVTLRTRSLFTSVPSDDKHVNRAIEKENWAPAEHDVDNKFFGRSRKLDP